MLRGGIRSVIVALSGHTHLFLLLLGFRSNLESTEDSIPLDIQEMAEHKQCRRYNRWPSLGVIVVCPFHLSSTRSIEVNSV